MDTRRRRCDAGGVRVPERAGARRGERTLLGLALACAGCGGAPRPVERAAPADAEVPRLATSTGALIEARTGVTTSTGARTDASASGSAATSTRGSADAATSTGEGADAPPTVAGAPPGGDASSWVDPVALDPTIRVDIRYATADNFVGVPLYPCGRCFLRPEVAAALQRAHAALQAQGYGGLLLFDCYRPRPVQQKMWDVVPDEDAVAPPWRGSNHNRGVAVDLSLVDADGRELDLGTAYDAFSPRASHRFTRLPPEVLTRRRDLRAALEAEGFEAYTAEWWHYAHTGRRWPLADEVWGCP